MNVSEYAQMAKQERKYWWHVGRLYVIKVWLEKWVDPPSRAQILNVGCGTGGTVPLLSKYGLVVNVDISTYALDYMKKRGYDVVRVKNYKLPFKDSSFDLVVAFDVLEHIKEHHLALQEWSRVLKPNGSILLTVPAYPWLWSEHDISLHHYRRYTKKLLVGIMPSTLKLVRCSQAIVFSLPLIVGLRLFYKLIGRSTKPSISYTNIPKLLNAFFIWLLKLESKLHKILLMPVGTSMIVLINKKSRTT